MEGTILDFAVKNGFFAILFVWLFLRTMQENKTREDKLNLTIEKNQSIIEKLASSLEVVKEIKDDIEDIKNGYIKPKLK